MVLDLLTAGATAAAPENKFGLMEALNKGGFISWTVFVLLVGALFFSLLILLTRWSQQNKVMKQAALIPAFWRAPTLREGAAKLEKDTAYRQLADDALMAQDQQGKLAGTVDGHDWLQGSLVRSEASVNSVLTRGMSFLATVGATAPFVGLFGTVVGIYKALIAIGIAGSASIDKVAGPVGEALIMTALGLLAAVPAVLAYNYLQGRNKTIAEGLSAFSNDLMANISSNGAIRPASPTTPAAKAARPAAPAATTTAPRP